MTADAVREEPPDPDPIQRQLLNQAQAISRLRRDLDSVAHETTDAAAELIARLEDLESRSVATGRAPAAWCWRAIGPQGSEELWSQLLNWVAWIRCRYPLARKIPPCWAEHSELVEELTALYLSWQHAYESVDAPLTAAADWHDRWLPGVLYRLEHGPFALDCANEHRARPATAYAACERIEER